jgi:LCP family protein required for cell wall assembly
VAASTSDPRLHGALKPGVYGPTVAFGKPRDGGPAWGRIAVLLTGALTAVAVLLAGGYASLLWWELQEIERNGVEIRPPDDGLAVAGGVSEGPAPPTDPVEERTTILLVGSDSREGLTDDQLGAIGTHESPGDLTDTIILLQIDPETDAAAMLSFPRDLVVTWCDGRRGRINRAYSVGEERRPGSGPACLVDTIQDLTGIFVDHYVRVNFAGFVRAVDALGGVEFYVDAPLQDRYSGIDIEEPGCVRFDGVKALQFVRARRIDNDFGRIARQQRFAREMLAEATSVGTLANPGTVASLISSISDVLETDEEFGPSEMVDLLQSVRDISTGRVDGRTVPGHVGRLGDASVVYLDERPAEQLFAAFRSGDLLPEGVGTDAEPAALLPENTIPVSVQNGSGEEGLAEDAARVVEALGFTVADTGNAENYGFDSSLILYPEERQAHAEVLSEALGGIATNAGSGDADELTLILGDAFDPERFAPEDVDLDATETPDPEPTASETEFVGAEESDVTC